MPNLNAPNARGNAFAAAREAADRFGHPDDYTLVVRLEVLGRPDLALFRPWTISVGREDKPMKQVDALITRHSGTVLAIPLRSPRPRPCPSCGRDAALKIVECWSSFTLWSCRWCGYSTSRDERGASQGPTRSEQPVRR
jgi:hypothetical protein